MSLLAWPLTLLMLVCMYPWTRWLLHRAEATALVPVNDRILLVLTTLGLSVGLLSLVMLGIGLLGIRIDWRIAAVGCLVIGASGFLARDKPYLLREQPLEAVPSRPLWEIRRVATILIAVIIALILFNAVYWPFHRDDAIAIYASFGKAIANMGRLPEGQLYETYPMLVPLSFAFTHQAAGWIDEHLAALIPALLSVGVIGAAYLLGHELFSRSTGLIAALLIAITPTFTGWASAGYVDLPCGFFYGMSALFLARHDRTRSWPDALLAGVIAGLAAWTKNSGLLIVLSIAAWIGYRWWMARYSAAPRALNLRNVLLIAGGFLVVAGPWYARNLSMAGLLVPPTGWTAQAERTLTNLLPYIFYSQYYVIGWIFTAGLALTLWKVWQSRGWADKHILLAVFFVPFFIVWWLLFSYEVRFLLVLMPIVAVMAADGVQEAFRRISAPQRFVWLRFALVFLVLFALPAISITVDFKFDLLRYPFMADADKHRVVLGPRYDMALDLRTLPAGSKVLTQDLLLPYHADGVLVTSGGLPTAAQLQNYDYWLLSPNQPLPGWFGPATPIFTEGGYRLYRVPRVAT